MGPPADKDEPSGRVKGTRGKGCGVKKGVRQARLDISINRPVQPESAIRGEEGRRADSPTELANKAEGIDKVVSVGEEEKGRGTVTGRPCVSYDTRKAGLEGEGKSRSAKGDETSGKMRWGKTDEEASLSSSETEEDESETSSSSSESRDDDRQAKALWCAKREENRRDEDEGELE